MKISGRVEEEQGQTRHGSSSKARTIQLGWCARRLRVGRNRPPGRRRAFSHAFCRLCTSNLPQSRTGITLTALDHVLCNCIRRRQAGESRRVCFRRSGVHHCANLSRKASIDDKVAADQTTHDWHGDRRCPNTGNNGGRDLAAISSKFATDRRQHHAKRELHDRTIAGQQT